MRFRNASGHLRGRVSRWLGLERDGNCFFARIMMLEVKGFIYFNGFHKSSFQSGLLKEELRFPNLQACDATAALLLTGSGVCVHMAKPCNQLLSYRALALGSRLFFC